MLMLFEASTIVLSSVMVNMVYMYQTDLVNFGESFSCVFQTGLDSELQSSLVCLPKGGLFVKQSGLSVMCTCK